VIYFLLADLVDSEGLWWVLATIISLGTIDGAWDTAKKIVEVELKMKNTALQAATVVGDTDRRSIQGHVLGFA
jgi:Na+/H+-translocating membrane pyrophosphatase